ncbi:uncharacterized protein LOC110104503 isoform X3 [Dendrobium catenatum]|uniref:uncharacterized protein LOC110104503 isoform X3 n=1 Tax=Dendrobium catenatum TaxID=906689 RepID=UPI00109FB3F2|nr:uncharacterized protein LOC110104503 isoform X3 [Dendrobium catenatum]
MARMGGADSSSFSSRASSSNSSSGFQNYPLISALLAFALAQSTKFFATWVKERRWDPKRLVGSGGMPSSHSATVTAVAIAIGFQDGFGSSLFAAAIVFACVVMYDAFGVRLHAGKQAEGCLRTQVFPLGLLVTSSISYHNVPPIREKIDNILPCI